MQRRALETMIKTYGQTPRQLFNGSHISRAVPKVLMEGELPAAMGLLVLAFRESREQVKEMVCPVSVRVHNSPHRPLAKPSASHSGEIPSSSSSSSPQSPLPWIKGLKWGEYVGSPCTPDPAVCFSQPHGERFGSLLALPTRAVCGLSHKFCLMMIYSKEQGRDPLSPSFTSRL